MTTGPLYFLKEVIKGKKYVFRCQIRRFRFRNDIHVERILNVFPV